MDELSHIDEQGRMKMVDVGEKSPTRRTAAAEVVLHVGNAVMQAVRDGRTPKGDVFAAAHVAGVMAAKRTAEWIPLCHPLPLENIGIEFAKENERIVITATVTTVAKTGVEMEALTAATAAALTLYDMLKAMSYEMTIERVRLLRKSGGRSGDWDAGSDPTQSSRGKGGVAKASKISREGATEVAAAVVTVSDRRAAGKAKDTAGPAVEKVLRAELGAAVQSGGIVPDEQDRIAERIIELVARKVDLVVAVGGTGFGPRDVTPEATRSVIAREAPGLAEAMRSASARMTPHAALQRGVCGIRDNTLIINLPGSEKGAVENLEAILTPLRHAIALLQGRDPH